jgi:poly(beta-D-mannuronate) lyase
VKHSCGLSSYFQLLGCALIALSLAPWAAAAHPAPLVSPWQAVPIELTQAPYDCAASPLIAPDILVTKGLGKSNLSPAVKEAVYPESDAALHDLTERTVNAADAFRHTRSQAAARCAITLLANAAADHAMAGYMASSDATQEQNMALRSIAIAYLKVRESGVAAPGEQALINAWFEDIARQERARMETGPCGQHICVAHGHHGIGIVMAAAAVAIATNDRRLFGWSVGQYRDAIRQIDDRGMLHYDTHGQYALKFNLVSAACLVQIAEFGEANGYSMYDYDHGRIHLLIHTVSRGLIDPGPFSSATGTAQRVSQTVEPWQITWAAVYNQRFPDPVISGLLEQVGPVGADMWGGEQLVSPVGSGAS